MIAVIAGSLTITAACGGEERGSTGVANIDSDAASDGGAGSDAASGSSDEAEYRNCMAAEGVDIPEPQAEGGNAVGSTTEPAPLDVDQATLEAASAKCTDELPQAPNPLAGLSPDQKAAFDDYMLKVEQCMTDKGYEGIPLLGEDGGNTVDGQRATDLTEPPDFDWEAFDAAAEDCYDATPLPEELEGLDP